MAKPTQVIDSKLETTEARESRKQAQADLSIPDPSSPAEFHKLLGGEATTKQEGKNDDDNADK